MTPAEYREMADRAKKRATAARRRRRAADVVWYEDISMALHEAAEQAEQLDKTRVTLREIARCPCECEADAICDPCFARNTLVELGETKWVRR